MSNIVKFEIDTYNPSFPMRVQNAGFSVIEGETMVSLAIATRRGISAVDATLTLLDPFGGEFWTGRKAQFLRSHAPERLISNGTLRRTLPAVKSLSTR